MVTDCQAMPARIGDDFPEEFLAHSGMVEAAHRIYRRLLVTDNILNQALTRCPDDQDYGIVVTGHSLGSGIASVLGFLLRERRPNLRVEVYAYAVVGGTLSQAAQKESEKFIHSVTLGDDVITRLSLASMQRYDTTDL